MQIILLLFINSLLLLLFYVFPYVLKNLRWGWKEYFRFFVFGLVLLLTATVFYYVLRFFNDSKWTKIWPSYAFAFLCLLPVGASIYLKIRDDWKRKDVLRFAGVFLISFVIFSGFGLRQLPLMKAPSSQDLTVTIPETWFVDENGEDIVVSVHSNSFWPTRISLRFYNRTRIQGFYELSRNYETKEYVLWPNSEHKFRLSFEHESCPSIQENKECVFEKMKGDFSVSVKHKSFLGGNQDKRRSDDFKISIRQNRDENIYDELGYLHLVNFAQNQIRSLGEDFGRMNLVSSQETFISNEHLCAKITPVLPLTGKMTLCTQRLPDVFEPLSYKENPIEIRENTVSIPPKRYSSSEEKFEAQRSVYLFLKEHENNGLAFVDIDYSHIKEPTLLRFNDALVNRYVFNITTNRFNKVVAYVTRDGLSCVDFLNIEQIIPNLTKCSDILGK